MTEVQEKFQKAGVYFGDGYVAVVDPWGLRPKWRGWRYPEVGTAVRYVNISLGNVTTRGLDTVSSGGNPTEESPHTSIYVSSKSPRPGCAIIPTGKNDTIVDEDDSVVSNYVSDMGEACDLRAAAMPDVSLSEGVRCSRTLHRKSAGTVQRYIGVCVCVCVRPV